MVIFYLTSLQINIAMVVASYSWNELKWDSWSRAQFVINLSFHKLRERLIQPKKMLWYVNSIAWKFLHTNSECRGLGWFLGWLGLESKWIWIIFELNCEIFDDQIEVIVVDGFWFAFGLNRPVFAFLSCFPCSLLQLQNLEKKKQGSHMHFWVKPTYSILHMKFFCHQQEKSM